MATSAVRAEHCDKASDHAAETEHRASYPYTFAILEPYLGNLIEERPEWQDALEHINCCDCVTLHWGHEMRYPFRLVVLIEWPNAIAQRQDILSPAWDILETMLRSPPQSYEISLGISNVSFGRSEKMDITIINGNQAIVCSELLPSLDDIQKTIVPRPDHDLTGVTASITDIDTSDDTRTIAVIMSWVDAETCLSQTKADVGTNLPAAARYTALHQTLQGLQSQEVVVRSFLVNLERYQPLSLKPHATDRGRRRHFPGERKLRRPPGVRERPKQLCIEE